MRTSQQQFEMLLSFMEEHGDLSKPSANHRGRINTMKHWDELTIMLNNEKSGDSKATEKWKKVWSDFKNNTKKKSRRIHSLQSKTCEGTLHVTELSHLEQRLMKFLGSDALKGSPQPESGLTQPLSGLTQPLSGLPELASVPEMMTHVVPIENVSKISKPGASPRRVITLVKLEKYNNNPIIRDSTQQNTNKNSQTETHTPTNVNKHRKRTREDDLTTYGSYIAAHLRKYSAMLQAKAKYQINSLLFKLDMESLGEGSTVNPLDYSPDMQHLDDVNMPEAKWIPRDGGDLSGSVSPGESE